MPIYEYACKDCNSQFEKFVRSMTAKAEVTCPECGGTHVKKGWSVFGTGNTGGNLNGLSTAAASSCNVGGTWGLPGWEPGALKDAGLTGPEPEIGT